MPFEVHLVDGTYELFRHFFAVPSHRDASGAEVGATRGVLGSLLMLLEGGATHVGVATDHVIESFRNALWPGYKTGEGIDPALFSQFPLLEEAAAALGVAVFAMQEREADDGMASAAAVAARDARVTRVILCTPDKDLAQCVGGKVFQLDRRKNMLFDAAAIEEKFGVPPVSIPDYLALVGDASDGYPGLPGWGAKGSAAVLARFGQIEAIPDRAADWGIAVRGAEKLGAVLAEQRELALLFKRLATLAPEPPVIEDAEVLRWVGPTPAFDAICARLGSPNLARRANALADRRSAQATGR
jgi:5'-3' exonuclease